MEEPEVKKAEEKNLAMRFPKVYKTLAIFVIVVGILILLWSIMLTTIAGKTDTLVYLMAVTMIGLGLWYYYFWKSKPIIAGIALMVAGISALLWGVISTVAAGRIDWFYIFVTLTGAVETAIGFWYGFRKSKRQ